MAGVAFGPFEIDPRTGTVMRGSEHLQLGHRAVALLAALGRRPGEIVTKAELMDAAWPGIAVEEGNLTVQIAALRKALGPAPGGGEWIATVPRVGYRFVGAPDAKPAAVSADRQSIAVLPFENLSADPEQDYFADGLAEEIITTLSKLSGLLVIARNSSFAYRGSAVDIREVASDLDVDYVLTGSVRKSGRHLRMAVQLIDAGTGSHLWAERYDRELTDVFVVQDEVTQQIVEALKLKLSPAEATGLLDGGTRDAEALELYQRGVGLISRPTQTLESCREGIAFMGRAIKRDPTYILAHTFSVIAYITIYSNRWGEGWEHCLLDARRFADRALEIDKDSAEAHAARALVAMLEKDHERLRIESERSLALNPNTPLGNLLYGGYLVNNDEAEAAIPIYEHAIRVDPAMTHLQLHHLGTAYLHAERYATAAALFRARIALAPRTDMSRAYLCAALGHLGEAEEAHRVWAELMALNPTYSITERLDSFVFKGGAGPKRILGGLRKAGITP